MINLAICYYRTFRLYPLLIFSITDSSAGKFLVNSLWDTCKGSSGTGTEGWTSSQWMEPLLSPCSSRSPRNPWVFLLSSSQSPVLAWVCDLPSKFASCCQPHWPLSPSYPLPPPPRPPPAPRHCLLPKPGRGPFWSTSTLCRRDPQRMERVVMGGLLPAHRLPSVPEESPNSPEWHA